MYTRTAFIHHASRVLCLGLLFALLGGLGRVTAATPNNAPTTATTAATTAATTVEIETTADVWLEQAAPSSNHGTGMNLHVSRNASNQERVTLLAFDTTPLPDNIAIISATVELFNIINEPNSTPQTVQDNDLRAEAVLGAWTEGGTTWNSRPPSSYLDDPPTTWAAYGWTKFDVTNIVQGWVDGGLENHGILLRAVPGQQIGSFYFSRETNAVPVLKIAYEPAPPVCEPLAVMVINGPTEAKRGLSYTYDATISPVSTTGPISYTWTSDGQPTQTTPTAVFNWDTTGNKTVNLTVQNCGGQTSNLRHTVITDPAPNCPAPLTDLQISGPTTAVSNRPLLFEAVVGPDEATTPISFHWDVTGQADRDTTGDLLADSINTTFGMGPKEVTVTAENCGGTFIRRHALYVDPPSALPDLRITGTWYESETQRIGYILQNQGGTAVPAGHQTDLFIDGTYQQSQTIGQSLPAGGIRVYYFNHNWSCGVTSVPLTLRADALGDVSENNEANNEHYASWPCDLVPPTLLSGPIISDVTETTATVTWQTSEPTHGRVEYGQTSYAPYSQDAPTFTSAHTTSLTGLQAGRTHRVRVFGEDNGDNAINSDWVYFQTSPPGTDPPQITGISVIETPGSPYEMFTIQVTLADATYVDRVAFYLDGALIGTQYGSFENTFYQLLAPHTLGYGRDLFYQDSGHEIKAIAYNIGGASAELSQTETFDDPGTPVRTAVIGPGDNHTIIFDGERVPAGTTQDVVVWASQYDWACTISGQPQGYVPGLRCSDANPQPVDEMRLYLSGSLVETHAPTADQFLHQFDLDLSNKIASERTLRFQAISGNGSDRVDQRLVLEQGEPQLSFTRSVSRNDNLFTIDLTIHNDGEGSAEVDEVQDMLQGFVALAKDNRPGDEAEAPADLQAQADGYYTVNYTPPNGYYWLNAPSPSVRINLLDSDDAVTIPPGESFTVQYEAIPVIYPHMSPNFYRIGVDENGNGSLVRYSYAGQSGNIESSFHAVGNTPNGPLTTAVEAAFASSDYLLVTNLYRLQSGASNADQIPGLLMDMARLAKEAEGVIALPTNLATAANIDDLLEPNGFWYESLSPSFRQTLGGYVLFVGEEEIIPVQSGGWGVDYSDLRYASTGGAARPELVLGRVIGDNVANLRKPIQAAASFHRSGAFFDGSHALIWSGRGDGEGTFWSNVKGMDSRLSDRGTAVTRFRSKDYSSETDLLPLLQQNSTGRDWIIYRGHGYRYGFADVGGNTVRTDTVSTLNLNARPVVLALACTTGDFRQNSDGDNSIAEAFLANGAGVFIGSVEVSSRARNSSASRAYFNRWHDGRPVGEILADIMRDTWGDSSWWWPDSMTWERWAYDYHNFGDPKYGLGVAPPKSALAGDETTAVSHTFAFNETTAQSAATINVTLPDLEIIPLDEGWHEVILPEGNQLALRDDYAVPVQTIIQTFPAGVRVSDVALTTQGGLVPFTGLNIQSNYFQLDGLSYFATGDEAFIGPERPLSDPYDDWFPAVQQPYQWRVLENPDGSSDLRLTIYPFYYNPATTDGRFYKTWQFEVTTVNSNVVLEGLTVPTTAEPGDQLPIELLLSNSGAAQDVVVTAEVLSVEGEPLAGLPLRSVDGLVDTAVVALDWDTTGLPTGDYRLNVLVTNRKGQTLANRDEVVTLGHTALGVSVLTANPSGQIAYTVSNTGTVAAAGTAVVHVQNEQMETIAMFSQPVPTLAPNAAQSFNAQWAASGEPNGDYRVSVFVSYDGTASAIAQASVVLGERAVYLPLITRP